MEDIQKKLKKGRSQKILTVKIEKKAVSKEI